MGLVKMPFVSISRVRHLIKMLRNTGVWHAIGQMQRRNARICVGFHFGSFVFDCCWCFLLLLFLCSLLILLCVSVFSLFRLSSFFIRVHFTESTLVHTQKTHIEWVLRQNIVKFFALSFAHPAQRNRGARARCASTPPRTEAAAAQLCRLNWTIVRRKTVAADKNARSFIPCPCHRPPKLHIFSFRSFPNFIGASVV